MLSYSMNGETLRPDHGKPLRAVIPGQIGGRSVKWLKRIIVSAAPSDNWYHIYDNRVLPTMVSPEQSANDPKTWQDERYAIYDLNVNSATVYPAHNEKVVMGDSTKSYDVKGYAYSGGGRRVTRIEVSLDQGRTWRLAHVNYPEDRYREANHYLFGGRIDMSWRESCFCWCHWNLRIPVGDLANADDIVVRAMDDSMAAQPREMYWSVLGMMNNPWFRVVIHKDQGTLTFEHPTLPALQPGGWMERVKKAGGNLTNGHWGEKIGGEEEPQEAEDTNDIKMTQDSIKREISADELKDHENDDDPWFVVKGEVYAGAAFLKGHPGGASSITSAAGQDSTDEFMAIHSETAKAMMPTYHIGTLSAAAKSALGDDTPAPASAEPRPVFLNPRSWLTSPLVKKSLVSSDTVILTFELEHPEQALGLPTGQHIMVRLRDPMTKEMIIRSYTPISETTRRGTIEVLIKLYLDTAATTGGRMSKALHCLPIGKPIEFKGPIGKFEYVGRGLCSVSGNERRVKRFAMICAGSGITPIFQVFRAVMRDQEDSTSCVVLNGNRNEEDILCRRDIDDLLKGNEHKAQVVHSLTKAPWGWEGRRGRVDRELIDETVGMADGETLVLICGPPALEKAVHKALGELGWTDEQILLF